MKQSPIVVVLLALPLLAASTAGNQGLDLVPIVGHWQQHQEDGEAVVVVDASKWDRKPLLDPAAVARQLFTAPDPQFPANASSPGAFPLAAVRSIDGFSRGRARAQFKLIAGASDQLAGLVFDLRPTGEYLAVRYNTKDGNVALWKYADGARARVAEGKDHAQLPLGAWHTIELQLDDRNVTGIVNGRLRVEHALETAAGGRVGFWAKPDSVSAFKAIRID